MIDSPILLDLPVPITTKRLTIRPMMPGDGIKVFEAIEESRNDIQGWLPWTLEVKTQEDSEKTVREFYADYILRKKFNFVIFKEDQFIGSCGFNELNWSIPSAAIGYWCRVSEQGKGYIRETTAALTLYAFRILGIKRLSILCADDNHKSAAIPESLGFTLEIKALGLLAKSRFSELCLGRRYVRFNDEGLDGYEVNW